MSTDPCDKSNELSVANLLETRIRTCTLMITHQCNLNCVYCYESFKSDKRMSFEMAKSLILKECEYVKNSLDYDGIQIEFMGGEPFMAFDLIKQVVDWSKTVDLGVPFHFFASTNGTLITNEVKDYLRANREFFVVGLSFDGTPDMQNLNRNDSTKDIDIDFFLQMWPKQTIKMTLSCDSISHFSEGIIYLTERGATMTANAGYGMPWTAETIVAYGRELKKLAQYYLAHPEIEPMYTFRNRMGIIFNEFEPRKFCGTGTAMVTYDVDGQAYPCSLFTPIVLGDARAADMQKQFDFNAAQVHSDERCEGCSLYFLCPSCYGFNYKYRGKIATREPVMCEIFKQEIEAYCWYRNEIIKRKQRNNTPLTIEDIAEAKGIVYYAKHAPHVLDQKLADEIQQLQQKGDDSLTA